jgi:D-amino-acid oxidase
VLPWLTNRRSTVVDYELADQIIENCLKLCPELTGSQGLNIVRHIVGRRPSRKGGARIEAEKTPFGLVVHNYGSPLRYSI